MSPSASMCAGSPARRARARVARAPGAGAARRLWPPQAARAVGRPAAARGAGAGAVHAPKVLLLDEPLGALDRRLRQEMQVELRAIQRESGVTTIFVTHDQEEALTLSDRIAIINEGRLVQIGAPPRSMNGRDPIRRPVPGRCQCLPRHGGARVAVFRWDLIRSALPATGPTDLSVAGEDQPARGGHAGRGCPDGEVVQGHGRDLFRCQPDLSHRVAVLGRPLVVFVQDRVVAMCLRRGEPVLAHGARAWRAAGGRRPVRATPPNSLCRGPGTPGRRPPCRDELSPLGCCASRRSSMPRARPGDPFGPGDEVRSGGMR